MTLGADFLAGITLQKSLLMLTLQLDVERVVAPEGGASSGATHRPFGVATSANHLIVAVLRQMTDPAREMA